MRKSLLISVLILVCAVWVQAQAYPQSSATQAAEAAGSTTVQGCLSGSSGSYTLTADNGTTYMLTGNTAELKDHVGHEVQITGKSSGSSASSPSSASGASSASSASSTSAGAGAPQALDVTSMKHIAKTCKSASK